MALKKAYLEDIFIELTEQSAEAPAAAEGEEEHGMTAVFKHELRSYFHSPDRPIVRRVSAGSIGIGAMLYNLQAVGQQLRVCPQLRQPGLLWSSCRC